MASQREDDDETKKKVAVDVTSVHGPASELGCVQNFFYDASRSTIYAAGGRWDSFLSQPLFLRSTDDGVTFTAIKSPATTGLRDVYANGDEIWVVGDFGAIWYSADCGKKWKSLRRNSRRDTNTFYCIRRDAEDVFWVCGDSGSLLRSTTGKSFRRSKTAPSDRLLRVYPDPLHKKKPWIVTRKLYRWTGRIFKEVPIRKEHGVEQPILTDLTRTPAGALLVVGDGGTIYRSEPDDDGAKWKRSVNPADSSLDLEAVLVTPFGILVVGDEGLLLASNDDGRTFVHIETSTKMEGHVWSVIAAGDGVLIGADQGGIYRLPTRDLAKIVVAAFEDRDATVAGLAAQIRDGADADDAQIVLEDALRERSLL